MYRTYKETPLNNALDDEELRELLPQLTTALYDDIFGTSEGWQVREDVVCTLERLRNWREERGGEHGERPVLGVVSNWDERLPAVLKGLGLAQYFDFVLTSRDFGANKPNSVVFDAALRMAREIHLANSRQSALAALQTREGRVHVGSSIPVDVLGALRAGWTAMHFYPDFDRSLPDWTVVDTLENAAAATQRSRELLSWGRRMTALSPWYELWAQAAGAGSGMSCGAWTTFLQYTGSAMTLPSSCASHHGVVK